MRVLGRGATPLLGALRRVTGVDLLADLGTFFQLLGDMTSDFSERAEQVERLLRAPTTAFLLVTSAEREPIEEAIWFHRTLEHGGLPFAGVVVNRVHHDLFAGSEPEDVRPALRRTLGRELAAKVAANFRDYHVLARPRRPQRQAAGRRARGRAAAAGAPARRRRPRSRGAAADAPLPVRQRRRP